MTLLYAQECNLRSVLCHSMSSVLCVSLVFKHWIDCTSQTGLRCTFLHSLFSCPYVYLVLLQSGCSLFVVLMFLLRSTCCYTETSATFMFIPLTDKSSVSFNSLRLLQQFCLKHNIVTVQQLLWMFCGNNSKIKLIKTRKYPPPKKTSTAAIQ